MVDNNSYCRNSKDVSAYLKSISDTADDKLIVLYLDNHNDVILTTFHQWNIDDFDLCSQSIIGTALNTEAYGVIIVHNQPSGSIAPSPDDKKLANNIFVQLDSFGRVLQDYIINSGDHRYYSMADNGTPVGSK